MDHRDFVGTSLRLRYEAFSKFATQVNQADSLPEISEAIAANLKFILDAFVFRLAMATNGETFTFELFRGQCTLSQSASFSQFERECIRKELPLTLTRHDIQEDPRLRDSLFTHPKVTHLMVLPIGYSRKQPLALSIANKSGDAYTEIDFRFARLIEELLSTKVSQLLLTQKIASKNIALEHANQQLSQLNEEVRSLNTELENKVKERTSRLNEAHQELNTLLYRTSHDFRRPLTSILGLAQLLTMSQRPDEIAGLVQHLESTVNGLDGMLVKLQTLMLTEVDEVQSAVNFVELAEKLQQKYQGELAESGIQFTYQIDHAEEYLSYSSIQWAILENLVENAIRHHGINEPMVHLQIQKKGICLLIQVIDNGEGIPDHLQPIVFDMYMKASNRTQGNGLGLFVVKKLVTALGGTVGFTSEEGKGSSFTVQLPLIQRKADALYQDTILSR